MVRTGERLDPREGFGFVKANQAAWPVRTMCRVLELSPSGYYAWVRRGLSARARRDAQLTERIKGIWSANREVYGRPRIHAELQEDGERIGAKRVGRLMRHAGIVGVSRRVVGWSMAAHLRTELVLDALNMAIWQRRPHGVVHHSDQGSQYTSIAASTRLTCRLRQEDCSLCDAVTNLKGYLSTKTGQLQAPAPDSALRAASYRTDARATIVGLRLSLPDHRGAQPASARRHRVQRIQAPRRRHQIIRLPRTRGLSYRRLRGKEPRR